MNKNRCIQNVVASIIFISSLGCFTGTAEAHPDNEITIDGGETSNPQFTYTIPKDSVGKSENSLPPEFVQSDRFVTNLKRKWSKPYNTEMNNNVKLFDFKDSVSLNFEESSSGGNNPIRRWGEGFTTPNLDTGESIDFINIDTGKSSNKIEDLFKNNLKDSNSLSAGGIFKIDDNTNAVLSISAITGSNYLSIVTSDGNISKPTKIKKEVDVENPNPNPMFSSFLFNQTNSPAYSTRLRNSKGTDLNNGKIDVYPVGLNGVINSVYRFDLIKYNDLIEYIKKEEIKDGVPVLYHFYMDMSFLRRLPDKTYLAIMSGGDEDRFQFYKTSLFIHFDSQGHILDRTPIEKIKNQQFITPIQSKGNEDYFFQYLDDGGEAKIVKITNGDLRNEQVVKTFPNGTVLSIIPNIDSTNPNIKYTFSGVIKDTSNPPFLGRDPGFTIGFMDEDFNILSVNTNSSNEITINDGKKRMITPNSTKLLDGALYSTGQLINVYDFTDSPVNGWKKKYNDFFTKDGYYSRFDLISDYAPGIKAKHSIVIDKDQLKTSEDLDRWAITGEKDGTKESKEAVQVTDTYDLGIGGKNQEWLYERINRNPLNLDFSIDWKDLGLDVSKVGPQQTTYFVTDSQMQTTSTSRVVNVIDNGTIKNKRGALSASNFAISLKDVDKLTDASLRDSGKYAKLKAWDLDTGKNILSEDISAGVKIDAKQLNIINQTKKVGIYDLTFTLTYGDKPETKMVKVFVADDFIGDYAYNTQENQIPWDISKDLSDSKYLSDYASTEVYKISTGEKIDKNNTQYELRASSVDELNLVDPNPSDYKATAKMKVPLSVWTKNTPPHKEVDLLNVADTTIYYRVEPLNLSFVNTDFGPLYHRSDESEFVNPMVVINHQIVGKPANVENDSNLREQINYTVNEGNSQRKCYLADKKTEVELNAIPVSFSNGKGNNYYVSFEPNKSKLAIKFVNEKGQYIKELYVDAKANTRIDLTKESVLMDAVDEMIKQNYQLSKRPVDETSVFVPSIESSPKVVTYEFKGTLFIQSAPSRIDFGTKNISYKDIEIDNPTFDKDLIIWDNRSDLPKWTVKARLSQVLTNKDDVSKRLPEAIKYKTGTEDGVVTLTNIETAIPLLTTQHAQSGKYNISDSWREGKSGFQLNIPAGSIGKLGQYEAEIVWTVSETP